MKSALNYRDPQFLRKHIQSIINFYHPACLDKEFGGYINQFTDNGTIYDRTTKHLVGTCRFIYNYSLAAVLFSNQEYVSAAAHGLRFLLDVHQQPDGGFAWILNGQEVTDSTRYCYGHAFVLLAAAGAKKAGVPGADDALQIAFETLEHHFWDPVAELYVDEIAVDAWTKIASDRGQNANMHLCEAMIAAWEATQKPVYLNRAATLARRICQDLAAKTNGLIWEHYRVDWTPDWEYNKEDPKNLFKPFGFLPGHFTEWSKLLLILDQHSPEPWYREKSKLLFDTALEWAWDYGNGGMNYSFDPEGKVLDRDRYYWVIAESFSAAALLAVRTGDDSYWSWYNRLWSYADRCFVDHEYGAWYRILGPDNRRLDDKKSPPSKTDYHPLAACYETLRVLGSA
jgi:mannose/cellobiose epimerase-like protein (N-acyl-D-glucosamine 2-epimerase family)